MVNNKRDLHLSGRKNTEVLKLRIRSFMKKENHLKGNTHHMSTTCDDKNENEMLIGDARVVMESGNDQNRK